MDWTPDQIRALAERLQERADRSRLAELTPRTARLMVDALRLYAVEAFARRGDAVVIEAFDLRRGTTAEVVGEVSDLDIARAVFDAAGQRRPWCRITMRKRGWVLGTRRPGEGSDGAA